MPPKKVGGKKKEDEEFDQLMKQLASSTAAKGKEDAASKKHEPKVVSQAERRLMHREREKAKEDALAKSLEQRAQQRQLQTLIREMMARNGSQQSMMFPFLDAPVTKIETETTTAKAPSTVIAGCASMQGWRRNMEDAHILYPNFRKASEEGAEDWHLFAVMDGHGGAAVAATVKLLLPAILHRCVEQAKGQYTDAALVKAFSETDAAILKKHGDDCTSVGTTCVTLLLGAKEVICASVGDSRAVLARKMGTPDDVVSLSFDHKAENEAERARIEAANGTVENNRVNGNLAMSRALGDYVYKKVPGKPETEQQVICVPDVHRCERRPDDEFAVVACDGIFDVLTNEELVGLVRKEIFSLVGKGGKRPTVDQLATIAGNITKFCLAPAAPEGNSGPGRAEGSDNMSIIIVML
jgi:protein phosphatase